MTWTINPCLIPVVPKPFFYLTSQMSGEPRDIAFSHVIAVFNQDAPAQIFLYSAFYLNTTHINELERIQILCGIFDKF